jgi:hypothetical protein
MNHHTTIPEQILQAVAELTADNISAVFSREQIRQQAGVSREDWHASYSPTFQGMRSDQPGGAPQVAERYRNIFRRVAHGKHTLTEYGIQQINAHLARISA